MLPDHPEVPAVGVYKQSCKLAKEWGAMYEKKINQKEMEISAKSKEQVKLIKKWKQWKNAQGGGAQHGGSGSGDQAAGESDAEMGSADSQ